MRTARSNIFYLLAHDEICSIYCIFWEERRYQTEPMYDVLIIRFYSHKYQMRLSCTLGQPSKYMCLDKNYTRSWLVSRFSSWPQGYKFSVSYPKLRSYTLFYSMVVVLIMTVYLVGMCQSRCTGFNSNPRWVCIQILSGVVCNLSL